MVTQAQHTAHTPIFTELHARSCFSFLRGASHPEDLIRRAAELGYDAIALPDHMGVYGAARAHLAAQRHGLRALVGATAEIPSASSDQGPNSGIHLPLLVKNRTGYQNLCRLLTDLHCGTGSIALPSRDSPPAPGNAKPLQVPEHQLLSEQCAGLVALLTPESLLQAHPSRSSLLQTATWLRDVFGNDNLYLTLNRHHIRGEERRNRLLIDLADHLEIPLLASNSPLFAIRRDRLLADALTCLRHHTTLDQAGTLLAANPERHLKHPSQVASLFRDHPEALLNTQRLADRLQFTLANLGYRFPSFHENGRPLPPGEEDRLLHELTFRGARKRYHKINRQVRRQLEHELTLISRLGFSGYFLIVWELVQFAKSQGILCQGRGSAANSAVCYCLEITACDPIGGGLLFERFLSENRKSWPDIDIDFPSGERREAVIQHVYEKYAPRGAAMTCNVITYRPRSAFREMSKVLDFPGATANRFSDLSSATRVHDHSSPGHYSRADADGTSSPSPIPSSGASMGNCSSRETATILTDTFEQAGVPANHPRFKPLLHLYQAALSLPRHLGQHSGGMIICDNGLDSIVPLQPAAMPNRTIVQWDKDDCEDLGIVKVDLLGLGMLAAMEDSLRICSQRGKKIDLAHIPYDDPATYDLLCRADTAGTFQVESRAQMATLPVMQPGNFYDLAIEIALIRPGPIVGDLVHPYLNRRNGLEEVDCIHPAFEPVLGRTLGVPLFQEQVLRMAMIIAGFDGAEADELRRAMAFKRSDERMESITGKLRLRMSERNIDIAVQEKVIQSIESFALYGFPESHAISFALIAYASCWLKVHHPAEFFAGLINNQPMGFYSVATLLQDARRHGIRSRPVSVLHSAWETLVIEYKGRDSLRLGLHRLKGLSSTTAERLLETRSHARFTDLPDFLHRARPNRKERRLLAASGALNDLPGVQHRRDALWQVEKEHPIDLFSHSNQAAGLQTHRHSPLKNTQAPENPLKSMTALERLHADYVTQGHTTGPHPMALWRRTSPATSPSRNTASPSSKPAPTLLRAIDFHAVPHGQLIACAGLVICRQRPGTAKGHCFLTLEDETGIANLFIPRETFLRHRLTITSEQFLLCHGRMQTGEGDTHTLYTTTVEPLPFPAELDTVSHDFH